MGGSIILITLVVFVLGSYWYFRQRYHHTHSRSREPFFSKKRLLRPFMVIGIIALPIVLVNFIFPHQPNHSPKELVEEGIAHQQPETILQGYTAMIREEPRDMALHFELIRTTYELHPNVESGWEEKLTAYYEDMGRDSAQQIRDIAHLGQGFIYYYRNDLNVALKHFLMVEQANAPYLNYGQALVMWKLVEYHKADSLFQQEIKHDGYLPGAYYMLAELYNDLQWDTRYRQKLEQLMPQWEVVEHADAKLKREFYFREAMPLRYAASILWEEWKIISPKGALAALFVMLAWLFYVRNLDVYEPEKWAHLILTFLLGFGFTYLVMPLHDLLYYIAGFNLDGGPINDFFYCWFGIGAVEELAKILPFLIMLKFSKGVNESYDYILYASVAALGFAFNENLIYYQEGQLNIISARALYTSVGHMFWSSIIAYGLLLNKLRYGKNPVLIFLGFYLLASLGHGFYDYWIINEWAMRFAIITTLFFLLSLHIWVVFINNSLNNSHFFDYRKKVETDSIQTYLIVSLLSILMFEYTLLGYKYGAAEANANLLGQSLLTGLFILYISSSLSNLEIVKGHWSPIRFPKNLLLPRAASNQSYLDMKVRLEATVGNFYLKQHLPVTGTIIDRVAVSGNKDWYLVQLDQSIRMRDYVKDKVIVHARHSYTDWYTADNVIVYFMMLPHLSVLKNKGLETKDLRFLGYALLNNVNED